MAFVLSIFPGFRLILILCADGCGVKFWDWLLFTSVYVEECYAESALCMLFLVIVHSHSRDFYKLGAYLLKTNFLQPLSEMFLE